MKKPSYQLDMFELLEEQGAASQASEHLKNLGIRLTYVDEMAVAHSIIDVLMSVKAVFGLDIETAPLADYQMETEAGLSPHLSYIRLLQIYDGEKDVYVFDVQKLGNLDCFAVLWQEKTFVAHNAVFELKHLMKHRVVPERLGCTMLQSNALNGDLPSLANLSESVLMLVISKKSQRSDWSRSVLSEDQINYAALDAVLTAKISQVQYPQLKERGKLCCYELMRNAQQAIASMEFNGVYIDVQGHSELIARWKAEQVIAEASLRDLIGPEINIASSKQLSEWLYQHLPNELRVIWPKTGRKEQLKTDDEALARFSHLEFVAPLLSYKVVSKKLGTYGYSFSSNINPMTKRIHASFRIGGTATGRLSCHDPNMQNLPRDKSFRSLFSAPEGRVLVVADYGQIELRIAAILSGDKEMLEAFSKGEDLHRKTAAAILKARPEDVTKEQRQMAKAVNFGLLYGQGASGLARYSKTSYGVDMTMEEAENARTAFFSNYTGLKKWQRWAAEEAKLTGRVVTPGGRIREFAQDQSDYGRFTEALNTPIQGGAAEVALAALVRIQKQLVSFKACLVNVVHDEIIIEASANEAEIIKKILEKSMIEGFLDIFPEASALVNGLVEAKIGKNWADCK